jgi:RimJ/RimL family protein N-acetyltransferase
VRNAKVWAGVLGVERSTVIGGVEFDDEAEIAVFAVPAAQGRQGAVRALSAALPWL